MKNNVVIQLHLLRDSLVKPKLYTTTKIFKHRALPALEVVNRTHNFWSVNSDLLSKCAFRKLSNVSSISLTIYWSNKENLPQAAQRLKLPYFVVYIGPLHGIDYSISLQVALNI